MATPSGQDHASNPIPEHPTIVFHPLPKLPVELRRKIWTHYLADVTPQMYRFKLRYPLRLSYNPWENHLPRADRIILQLPDNFGEIKYHIRVFKASLATRHIASATCVESRQVVLELCPDTLRFRQLPSEWMRGQNLKDSPQLAGFPEYTLRYNSRKDIIILQAAWEDREAAIKIAEFMGRPPDDFLKMRHVGIAVNALRVAHNPMLRYGTSRSNCQCITEECRDHCKKEPLVGLLSLFPLLESFYIANIPLSTNHLPDGPIQSGKGPSKGNNCPCPNNGPRHSWPMIKNQIACGWFVIYNERSGCQFPKIDKVEDIRRRWRPHFPSYQALSHLEIKFIQLWDPDLLTNSRQCNRCVYRS